MASRNRHASIGTVRTPAAYPKEAKMGIVEKQSAERMIQRSPARPPPGPPTLTAPSPGRESDGSKRLLLLRIMGIVARTMARQGQFTLT